MPAIYTKPWYESLKQILNRSDEVTKGKRDEWREGRPCKTALRGGIGSSWRMRCEMTAGDPVTS